MTAVAGLGGDSRVGPQELLAAARRLRDDAVTAGPGADFGVHLDLAVLDAEFERVLGRPLDARGHWQRAVTGLRTAGPVGPWLYRGAAQLGWTGLRLGRTPPPAVDELLAAWVDDYPADGELDLPRGLLGIGVYALAHPDRALAQRWTDRLLDELVERADTPGGLAARSGPAAGTRLVGLAHGAAGLVAYLASVVRSDLPAAVRAAPLLRAELAWLLDRRRPGGVAGSVYPRSAAEPGAAVRSAWCHGDPGVWLAMAAAAASGAGPAAGAATAAATEVADAVLARDPADTGVVDGTLCHGAAGLLWITHRIGRATGDPRADDRAAHWAGWLHDQRAAGPLRYLAPTATMERDHSFLSGDTGVALVLLAVATGHRPAWEQLLLGV